MGESKFIPGYNPSANKNFETGRKGKFWEDQAGVAERYAKQQREFAERTAETKKITAELNDPAFGKKLEKKSFPALFKGFTAEVAAVRAEKVKYDNIKLKNNPEEIELLYWTGENVLTKADELESEILKQIEATTDVYEKSDFDKLRLELAQITINVTGLPEKKVVNE